MRARPWEAKFAYLTVRALPRIHQAPARCTSETLLRPNLHTLQCARSLGFTMPRRGAFRRPFRGQFCLPYSARGSRGANLRNIRSFLALASPGHFLGFEQPFPGGCPSTQKYREICSFLALARPSHFLGFEEPFPRGSPIHKNIVNFALFWLWPDLAIF